ncbi:MAG: hypothetical protein AB7G44_13420 [Bacteroidia bacterium]
MQTVGHFNRTTLLTIVTVGLAGLQSYLLHIMTTDFAHKILSAYFFTELFILLLTLTTGLKTKRVATILLFAFAFEFVWFFAYDLPISPDHFLILVIGATRVYILYWLFKRQTAE